MALSISWMLTEVFKVLTDVGRVRLLVDVGLQHVGEGVR